MAMLHRVMRPSIDSARMVSPLNSIAKPVAPAVPSRPMMASTKSLAVTPAGKRALHIDLHALHRPHDQALRGHHMLDLGGADAERQRRERAVRAGVRVAGHDGHARQRGALLRADHVDDSLPAVAERELGDAELAAVACRVA